MLLSTTSMEDEIVLAFSFGMPGVAAIIKVFLLCMVTFAKNHYSYRYLWYARACDTFAMWHRIIKTFLTCITDNAKLVALINKVFLKHMCTFFVLVFLYLQ